MSTHIIIDRDNMQFVAGAKTSKLASLIAWCDHPDVATVIVDTTLKRNLSILTRLEVAMLYKNLTGNNCNIWEYEQALQTCFDEAGKFPEDTRTVAELEKLTETLPVEVADKPIFIPAYYRAADLAAASAPNQAFTKESKPALNPASRPSPKGSTGRVWEIADLCLANHGGKPKDMKILRKEIIVACVAEGINEGTAGVQYGKWKATKSI